MNLIWKKCPDLPYLGPIWPTLGPNLVSCVNWQMTRNQSTIDTKGLTHPTQLPLLLLFILVNKLPLLVLLIDQATVTATCTAIKWLSDGQESDQCCKQLDKTRYNRDGRFGSKVGQIGPKQDKSGAFSDQISVLNALKSDLKKSRICTICGQTDPLWSQTYHPWAKLKTD